MGSLFFSKERSKYSVATTTVAKKAKLNNAKLRVNLELVTFLVFNIFDFKNPITFLPLSQFSK